MLWAFKPRGALRDQEEKSHLSKRVGHHVLVVGSLPVSFFRNHHHGLKVFRLYVLALEMDSDVDRA